MNVRDRGALDEIATQLADALGIDPEWVQIDYPNNRISISAKQASRIVALLTAQVERQKEG